MLNSKSIRGSRRRWLYPFISGVAALGIGVGTPQPSQAIPLGELLFRGIEVFQMSNLSNTQEVQLGQQINQQLVTTEVPIYRNQALSSYINNIGQRLAKCSDRRDIPYTFQVVGDNNINAFATMGGFVYINTGTIAAADNESQLASVIGHEIAHITSRHAVKQMREGAIAQGISSIAGVDRNRAVQIGVELALRRPKSRQAEYEADRKGLAMLKCAGYAPSGMPAFMAKLVNSNSPPTFLSTHPGAADRVTALRQAIDPAKANVGNGLDSAAYKRTIRALAAQR